MFRLSHRTIRGRLAALLLLALLLLSACSTAPALTPTPAATATAVAATPGITLQAQAAFDGAYQSGSWLPVTVTVQNDGPDRRAAVQVGTGQSSFAAMLDLPRGARKSATVYAYLPNRSRHLDVWLMEGDRRLAQDRVQLRPHTHTSHMIAAIGNTSLPRLPDQLVNGAEPILVTVDPLDLPDHPLGLSSFATLLLADVDTRLLSAEQRRALRDWVALGGQLLLSGGPGAAATLAGLDSELQPVQITGNRQLSAIELLGVEVNQPLTVSDFAPIGAEALLPRPNRALAGDLVVERALGQGLVGFVAPAITSNAFAGLVDSPLFWADLLELRQLLPLNFGPGMADLDSFVEGNLAPVLTSLPALEFPSLLLIGGLILLYILLVGPVSYVLLRRYDRLALGWLLIPLLTLIFSLAGYVLSYQQRGGDVVFNQVALLEQVDGGQFLRLRSFLGMFSPAQQAYSLTIGDQLAGETGALLRPISLQGFWGPAAATGNAVFLQSASAAEPLRVQDLTVAQWSMQAMLLEQLQPGLAIDAELHFAADNLQASVRNASDLPLRDVVVVQGDQVARLGDLAPGETRQVALSRNDARIIGPGFAGKTPLSYLVYGEELDRAGRQGEAMLDPEVQQRVRLLDAIAGYGPVVRDARPLLLAWIDTAPFRAEVPGQRAESRSLSLLTMQPKLLAEGTLQLEAGWLQSRYDTDPASLCVGGQGLGALPNGQSVQVRLRLPRHLRALQVDHLALLTSAEGLWPAETSLRVFDWQHRAWVAVDAIAERIPLAEPARFVNAAGTILAEFQSPPSGMMNAGCLYLDAEVGGTLP